MIELHYAIKELEKDMQEVMEEASYTLHTASGCGTVLAAMIIGEIGDEVPQDQGRQPSS